MKVFLIAVFLVAMTASASAAQVAAQEDTDCASPRLVLELPAEPDYDAILQTFAFLQARGDFRTLILARPAADLDTLRLALAAGNQVALIPESLDADPLEAQIAIWEKLMIDLAGHPGLRLLHGDGAVEAMAASLDYRLLARTIPGCDSPPPLLTILIDGDAVDKIYRALYAGAVPHEAAAWQYASPIAKAPATPKDFKAAHIVVIDPGHTRMDRGASILGADGEYVTEHWSNLQRAYAMRAVLERDGWVVVLAHDDGWFFEDAYHGLDMDRDGFTNNHDSLIFRAQYAYYVSLRAGRRAIIVMLHADSGAPELRGHTIFYPDPYELADADASHRLGALVDEHLGMTWAAIGVDTVSRGVYPGRTYGRERGAGAIYDIIAWRYRELPAVWQESPPLPFVSVLIEVGMASNPEEAIILATEKGNARFGISHAEALEAWMHGELGLEEE